MNIKKGENQKIGKFLLFFVVFFLLFSFANVAAEENENIAQNFISNIVGFFEKLFGGEEPLPMSAPFYYSVSQGDSFTFTSRVTCVGGECGDVEATLDPSIIFDTNIDDNYMSGQLKDTNSGSDIQLVIRGGQEYQQRFPLIRFNDLFSQIPVGATIAEAKLFVYQGLTDANFNSNMVASIYALKRPWTETASTYNSYDSGMPWASPGANGAEDRLSTPDDQITIYSTSPQQRWYEFDVTSSIQMMLEGGLEDNYGWVIYSDSTGGGTYPYFISSENSQTNLRPYLTVTYEEGGKVGAVPENSGNLFYTTSLNPQNPGNLACLDNMVDGQSCDNVWTVFADANAEIGDYEFYTIYDPITYNQAGRVEPQTTFTNDPVTITILSGTGDNPPQITNLIPLPGTNQEPGDVDFSADVTDDNSITSISLWIDDGSGYVEEGIVNPGVPTYSYFYTMPLAEGNYNWYLEACDGVNDCVDSTPRNLIIESAQPGTPVQVTGLGETLVTQDSIVWAWTYAGDPNCAYIQVELDSVPQTPTLSCTDLQYTANNLNPGTTYTLGVATYNSLGDTLGPVTDSAITSSTGTPPIVSFVSPTPDDGATLQQDYVEVATSINDPDVALQDVTFTWDETPYKMYDSSSKLIYNFDRVVALGETNTLVVNMVDNANNANVNGATYGPSGKYNGAFYYDGVDDFMTIINGYTNLFSGDNTFTIETWIHPMTSLEGMVWSREAGAYFYGGITAEGAIKIGTGQGNFLITNNGLVTVGGDYHIAFVKTGATTGEIYLNGEMQSTTGALIATPTANDGLLLGKHFVAGLEFQGVIDEFRIYNNVFDASTIKQHYFSNLKRYDLNQWRLYSNEQGLTQGNSYTFQTTATNDAGSSVAGPRTVTLEVPSNNPPTVSLSYPIDEYYSPEANGFFGADVADDDGVVDAVRLIIGGLVDQESFNVPNGVKTFSKTFVPAQQEQSYSWTIEVDDGVNAPVRDTERTLYIDTIVPTVNILTPVDGEYTHVTPRLTFTYSDTYPDLDSCEYSVNGNPRESMACDDQPVLPSNPGVNSVTVYVSDLAGNEGSDSVQWIFDNENPLITFNFPPENYRTKATTIQIELHATDNVGIDAGTLLLTFDHVPHTIFTDLGGGNYLSEAITMPADGSYEYSAIVYDLAGNQYTTSYETVTLDTTAPGPVTNLQEDSHGSDWIKWTWINPIDSDFDHLQLQIDGEPIIYNYGPEEYTASELLPGQHTIYLWSVDDLGNVMTSPVQNTFNLDGPDQTPPSLQFESPPTPEEGIYLDVNYFTIQVVADEPLQSGTCTLYLNDAPISMTLDDEIHCSVDVNGQLDGEYTFYVTAEDLAGNLGSNQANERTITIDQTTPTVNFVLPTPPDQTVTQQTTGGVYVSVIEDNVATVTLNFDGVLYPLALYSGNTYRVTGVAMDEGEKTYYYDVTVVDQAQHSAMTETRRLILDQSFPEITFNSPTPSNLINYQNQNEFTIDTSIVDANLNLSSVKLYFNGVSEDFDNQEEPHYWETKSNLGEGQYDFYVHAGDKAGSTINSETRTVVVDLTNPIISFVDPTPVSGTVTDDSQVTIAVHAEDDYLDTDLFVLDFGGTPYTTPQLVGEDYYFYVTMDQEVEYSYSVSVSDLAGNSETTETRTIEYNLNVPPQVTGLGETGVTDNSIIWTWINPNSPQCDHIDIEINDEYLETIASDATTYTAVDLAPGQNYQIGVLTVNAEGNAGNAVIDYATTTGEDLTPPAVKFVEPTPLDQSNTDVNVIVAVKNYEVVTSCDLILDGDVDNPVAMELDTNQMDCSQDVEFENGEHTFYVNAIDSNTNEGSSETRTIRVGIYCGNGICDSGESCSSCETDCGACETNNPPGGGGGGGGWNPPPNQENNESHGNVSLNRKLLEDPKLRQTMKNLLGRDLSESDFQQMMTIVPNAMDGVIPLERKLDVKDGVSELSVKFTYTGQKKLMNLFAYKLHPKIFTNGDVREFKALGGTYSVVEPDPSYLFYYPEVYPGQIIKVVYGFDKVLTGFDINTILTAVYATGFGDIVCNSDGVCNTDAGENSFGCSEDCPFYCVPDENRCVNDNLEVCNILGENWEVEERCEKGCDKETLTCKEAGPSTGTFWKSIGNFFKKAWIYFVIVLLGLGVVFVGYLIYRKIKQRQSSSFDSGVFLDKRYKGI